MRNFLHNIDISIMYSFTKFLLITQFSYSCNTIKNYNYIKYVIFELCNYPTLNILYTHKLITIVNIKMKNISI